VAGSGCVPVGPVDSVSTVEHLAHDVPVFYLEHGEGLPVLALHGAGVDHREVMACLEPVLGGFAGYRRIYLDLPGMGRTPAPETISSADDVLDVLLAFIDGVVGDVPMLVAGHSAGGYYAQAIAGRRPEQVVGLALLCPLLAGIHDVPEHAVTVGSGDLGDAEFRDYFTQFQKPWNYADSDSTAARLTEAGFVGVSTGLESSPVRFGDAASFAEFVTTVICRPYVACLPDARTRDAFIGSLTRDAAADDPPFELDYWRLNMRARKPGGC